MDILDTDGLIPTPNSDDKQATIDDVLSSTNAIKRGDNDAKQQSTLENDEMDAFVESSVLPFTSIPDSNQKWKAFAKQLMDENKCLEVQCNAALMFHKRLVLQQVLRERDLKVDGTSVYLWQGVIQKRMDELKRHESDDATLRAWTALYNGMANNN